MEKLPMISVCMITFGHEAFIRAAIEGVLMQVVNFEVEFVIADDNSPDGTSAIVNDYISNSPKGHWIRYTKHAGNKGMMSNFVWALRECRGKYIALCEGDDFWTDSFKLQKQFNFMETNPDYSGCFHDTKVIYESMGKEPRLFRNNLPNTLTAEDTIAVLSPFHTTSFLFRLNALEFPHFLQNVVSGDMALFSIIAASGKLGKVDGVMSVYRKHQSGVTYSKILQENYHKKRLELVQYLDAFHNYQFNKKALEVIAFHKKSMSSSMFFLERIRRKLIRLLS